MRAFILPLHAVNIAATSSDSFDLVGCGTFFKSLALFLIICKTILADALGTPYLNLAVTLINGMTP